MGLMQALGGVVVPIIRTAATGQAAEQVQQLMQVCGRVLAPLCRDVGSHYGGGRGGGLWIADHLVACSE